MRRRRRTPHRSGFRHERRRGVFGEVRVLERNVWCVAHGQEVLRDVPFVIPAVGILPVRPGDVAAVADGHSWEWVLADSGGYFFMAGSCQACGVTVIRYARPTWSPGRRRASVRAVSGYLAEVASRRFGADCRESLVRSIQDV